jgi:hypothetical protein
MLRCLTLKEELLFLVNVFCNIDIFAILSSFISCDSVEILACESRSKRQGTVDFLKWNFFLNTYELDKDCV